MKHRIHLIITSLVALAALLDPFSIAIAQKVISVQMEGSLFCSGDLLLKVSSSSVQTDAPKRYDNNIPSALAEYELSRYSISIETTRGYSGAALSVDSRDKTGYAMGSETVYICTGKNAYAYHRKANCRGLKNCRSEIIETTRTNALEAGYSKCKICYR